MEFDDIITFVVVVGGILLSAFGGKKKPKQKTKKEAPSIDINTYEVEDEELF